MRKAAKPAARAAEAPAKPRSAARKAGPNAVPRAAAAAKPKTGAKPKAAAKPRATAKPQTVAEPKPAAKPRSAAEAMAAAKPKGAAKPRTAAKPETAARSRGAAKPEATVPAAPRPASGRKRRKLAPDRLSLLVEAAVKSLEQDKAEDIVVLDVSGRADYADRLIIATGLVERQLQAMATHLDEALGKAGLRLTRDAIQASPDWVLIDAGDLVIHLFRPEARALYRLERMWGPESPGGGDASPG